MRNTSRNIKKTVVCLHYMKSCQIPLPYFFVNGKDIFYNLLLNCTDAMFFLCWKSYETKKCHFNTRTMREKIDTKEQHSFWCKVFWLINSYASFIFVLFYYRIYDLFHHFFHFFILLLCKDGKSKEKKRKKSQDVICVLIEILTMKLKKVRRNEIIQEPLRKISRFLTQSA